MAIDERFMIGMDYLLKHTIPIWWCGERGSVFMLWLPCYAAYVADFSRGGLAFNDH